MWSRIVASPFWTFPAVLPLPIDALHRVPLHVIAPNRLISKRLHTQRSLPDFRVPQEESESERRVADLHPAGRINDEQKQVLGRKKGRSLTPLFHLILLGVTPFGNTNPNAAERAKYAPQFRVRPLPLTLSPSNCDTPPRVK